MGVTVFTGIGTLVTNDPSLGRGLLGELGDAWLVVVGGRVAALGTGAPPAADRAVDVGGAAVIPGFVDSHSHLVFAGDRAEEFAARMAGQPYAAGGILTTVEATRAASDDELATRARRLLTAAHRSGTTTIEVKSGYGLNVVDEARTLRIAAELSAETTFLGAHVVPAEMAGRTGEYVELVTGAMLDACAPFARWIDAFCERGAFDADQCRSVLEAGRAAGLGTRLHANQLGHGPGVQLAVELGCASADHCTYLTPADVDALASGSTVATLLPATDFSTRQPYPNARQLLDAGAVVALACNCNPGSSFTTSMPFCLALAVREMHMTVDEAIWSATKGGAVALRRDDIGHLAPGARADLVVLDAASPIELVYRPGVDLVAATFVGGVLASNSTATGPAS
ncbi:MAG: imidazolonepropionase [Actinomycetota bacterium]|nr:MAG: imidazolonepropionase [Actinomycetota bacterium]